MAVSCSGARLRRPVRGLVLRNLRVFLWGAPHGTLHPLLQVPGLQDCGLLSGQGGRRQRRRAGHQTGDRDIKEPRTGRSCLSAEKCRAGLGVEEAACCVASLSVPVEATWVARLPCQLKGGSLWETKKKNPHKPVNWHLGFTFASLERRRNRLKVSKQGCGSAAWRRGADGAGRLVASVLRAAGGWPRRAASRCSP